MTNEEWYTFSQLKQSDKEYIRLARKFDHEVDAKLAAGRDLLKIYDDDEEFEKKANDEFEAIEAGRNPSFVSKSKSEPQSNLGDLLKPIGTKPVD